MKILFFALRYIYPLCCVFLPCIAYQVILYRKWDHHGRLDKGPLIWRYVLILYLFLMMTKVGPGSIWDIMEGGLNINPETINLKPFHFDSAMTHILNVILFMPLGFLLPLIWGRYRSFTRTACAGMLMSLMIELGQLFNHRLTDVDDLIMNTLGTIIGFGLWHLMNRRIALDPREERIFPDKAHMYLALALIGSFLLNNWRWTVLLYGGRVR